MQKLKTGCNAVSALVLEVVGLCETLWSKQKQPFILYIYSCFIVIIAGIYKKKISTNYFEKLRTLLPTTPEAHPAITPADWGPTSLSLYICTISDTTSCVCIWRLKGAHGSFLHFQIPLGKIIHDIFQLYLQIYYSTLLAERSFRTKSLWLRLCNKVIKVPSGKILKPKSHTHTLCRRYVSDRAIEECSRKALSCWTLVNSPFYYKPFCNRFAV